MFLHLGRDESFVRKGMGKKAPVGSFGMTPVKLGGWSNGGGNWAGKKQGGVNYLFCESRGKEGGRVFLKGILAGGGFFDSPAEIVLL